MTLMKRNKVTRSD